MYLYRTFITAGLAAGLAFAQASPSTETAHPTAKGNMGHGLAKMDRDFVLKAAEGGRMEIEMGQQALEKATNPDVKKFAQQLIDDHTKANDELKEIAGKKALTLDSKSPDKMMSKMSKMSGDQYDRAFIKNAVADHVKDVAEFEKASKSVADPEIRAFAEKTLPTLREHLQMARSLSDQQMNHNSANPSSTR